MAAMHDRAPPPHCEVKHAYVPALPLCTDGFKVLDPEPKPMSLWLHCDTLRRDHPSKRLRDPPGVPRLRPLHLA